MSSSASIPVYDAYNSHVFEEGVEKETAANKRTFLNEQLGAFIIFPAFFAFIVYVLLTSDYPFWQVVASVIFLGAIQATMILIAVRSFKRPRIHAIQITSDGALALGPHRWELRSVSKIERSGSTLTFRDRNGKRLLTITDYQVGDFESFTSAVNRAAPGVTVGRDPDTTGPHLVRMRRM